MMKSIELSTCAEPKNSSRRVFLEVAKTFCFFLGIRPQTVATSPTLQTPAPPRHPRPVVSFGDHSYKTATCAHS